jgi:hypothetical protein
MITLNRFSALSLFALCFIQWKTLHTRTIDSENFYPLNKGIVWNYNYYGSNDKVTVKVSDSDTVINGNKYFKLHRIYSWNSESVDYARNENGITFSYDDKTKGESIVIPNSPKIGFIWKHFDNSWEYEILSTDAKVTTPAGTHKKLLKIRAVQLTNRDKDKKSEYHLYFKKGIGNVATEGDGKLMTYLTNYKL